MDVWYPSVNYKYSAVRTILMSAQNLYKSGEDDTWDDTLLIQAWNESWIKMKKSLPKNVNIPLISQNSKTRRPTKTKIKWQVDDICYAIWDEDGEEYMAKIIEIDEKNDLYKVLFMDYGHDGDVSYKDLRKITKHDNENNHFSDGDPISEQMPSKNESNPSSSCISLHVADSNTNLTTMNGETCLTSKESNAVTNGFSIQNGEISMTESNLNSYTSETEDTGLANHIPGLPTQIQELFNDENNIHKLKHLLQNPGPSQNLSPNTSMENLGNKSTQSSSSFIAPNIENMGFPLNPMSLFSHQPQSNNPNDFGMQMPVTNFPFTGMNEQSNFVRNSLNTSFGSSPICDENEALAQVLMCWYRAGYMTGYYQKHFNSLLTKNAPNSADNYIESGKKDNFKNPNKKKKCKKQMIK